MRSLYTFLLVVAGIYVFLAALLFLFQNRMVFLADLPGRTIRCSRTRAPGRRASSSAPTAGAASRC